MATNEKLGAAKKNKSDEFYTQYEDIEAEMNAYIEYNPDVFKDKTILLPCDDPEWSNFTRYFAANFTRLKLKKLISTSYAQDSKTTRIPLQLSLFEVNSPDYDETKTNSHGKIFTLTRQKKTPVDIDDLKWKYLDGDGDFRSEEVTKLRDEADIIITNPPFSLFREFLAWITGAGKQFIIVGNQNAITYKEVFPLILENRAWLGYSIHSGDRKFNVPDDYPLDAASCGVDPDGRKYIRVKGVRWFTNIDHGKRHEKMDLDTMAHNLKYNNKLKKQLLQKHGKLEYPRYSNYDAIDVPIAECVPSDYSGTMGVPISFIDKYNPEQFELVGCPDYTGRYGSDETGIKRIGEEWIRNYRAHGGRGHYTANMTSLVWINANGEAANTFKRILIRPKKAGDAA